MMIFQSRSCRAVLWSIALGVILAVPGWTATNVRFEITMANGSPAQGATVSLSRLEDPLHTDKEGRATASLEPGIYRVMVQHERHEQLFSKIRIPKSNNQVKVQLRLRW